MFYLAIDQHSNQLTVDLRNEEGVTVVALASARLPPPKPSRRQVSLRSPVDSAIGSRASV